MAVQSHLAASSSIRQKKSRRDFLHGAILFKNYLGKSGLCLLRVRVFLALLFQLSELLGRKNFFGLFQERLPAFLRAASLYAFCLPAFDFCLLIGREIKRCQIDARHRVRFRRALGATRVISCKRAGCRQQRSSN
jgi:hypothetical protein